MDRPTPPPDRSWVADPSIPWRILLTATPTSSLPDDATIDRALGELARVQGWQPPPALRVAGSAADLRVELAAAQPAEVVLGRAGAALVVSAHHAAVDGLGLLRVLEELGPAPVRSAARGVGGRRDDGGPGGAVARRLLEALFVPPAGISRPGASVAHPAPGDVMVDRSVPGPLRTADLVHAATQAVVAHEAARGRRAHRVAIAVGASRDVGADDGPILDRSALLRLRNVERLDRAGVVAALRAAVVRSPPVPAGGGNALTARAASAGMRVLAPRLGSTLLVSHLGEVSAPGLADLLFHPVTAGGTGLSLGAVGLGGRTTLTLRARAAQWNDDGLEQLLEAVISLL